MLWRGNLKNFNDNADLVRKAMNKKDWYSHLVTFNEDICCASAYLSHTSQTVVTKPGKNNHLVWDGTTTLLPLDIVINQVTPVTCEAPITFGHMKINFILTSTTRKSAIQMILSFWEWRTSRHDFFFQGSTPTWQALLDL
jgi:hypothetical protein